MDRSKHVSGREIAATMSHLSDNLDFQNFIYPPALSIRGLSEKSSYRDVKQALLGESFGYETDPDLERFELFTQQAASQTRKAHWTWRIGAEAAEKQENGWYPFFVTLTCDPSRCEPEQLWRDGREFRKYIRRLANVSAKECGHPPPHKSNVPEREYVTYAGVVEHGASREHHHMHLLVWLRAIPSSWKQCPNRHIRNPQARTRLECLPMQTLWPWSLPGLSKVRYFRTVGDVWSFHGFCIPIKDGKPLKIAGPRAGGRYMTKYITKEFKEWHHRVKATRNLGMAKLRERMWSLATKTLEALTWRPPLYSQSLSVRKTHSVPLALVRSLAKQIYFARLYEARLLDLKTVTKTRSGGYQRMLQSVRNGQRPDRMPLAQFYEWVSAHLPDTEGFCNRRFQNAHKRLRYLFPVFFDQQRTAIGGNVIGSS